MPVPERVAERRYQALLRLLFATALAARLVFVLFVHSPRDYVYSDMQSYDGVAFELLRGHLSPWHAFRPVGYSMLLAISYLLTDASRTFVGVLQAMMAAALVPWSAQLTRAAGGGRFAGALCALAVATSLPLTFYCGFLLTEVPTAFFVVLGLKWLFEAQASMLHASQEPTAGRKPRSTGSRHSALRAFLGSGLCFGVAGALRPNILLLYPVLGLYLAWRLRSVRRAPALVSLALATCLPLFVVCGYNSRVLGRVAGPAANGGINFYLNFADVRTLHYQGPLGAYWISPVPNGFHFTREELTDVPLFNDGYYYARGLSFLRAHPEAWLRAFENFREVAGIGNQLLWPNWAGHERLLRNYAVGFFWGALLPALVFGSLLVARWRRWKQSPEPVLLAGLCFASVLPTYFFLGDPRVRVPFDPLWILLAALAYEGGVRRLTQAVRRARAG